MPATMYGPDLAEVYRTGAAVKGQRLQNRLAQGKLDQMAGAGERQNRLTSMRQKAAGGGRDARRDYAIMDPEGSAKFFEAMDKADAPQIKKMEEAAEDKAKSIAIIMQIKDPVKQQELYGIFSELNPAVNLPEKYDLERMDYELARISTLDQILKNPKVSQVGGEDVVYKGGREIERKARPVKAGEAGVGLKTADEKAINRFVGELYDSTYNPITGKFSMLSKDDSKEAASIAAEAIRIYTKGKGKISRRDSANRAARKAGAEIEDLNKPTDPNDPASMRGHFAK